METVLIGSSIAQQYNKDHTFKYYFYHKGELTNRTLTELRIWLDQKQIKYKTAYVMGGNTIFPSKIHRTRQNKQHCCFKPFDEGKVQTLYNKLVEILSEHCLHILIVEPNPRCLPDLSTLANCVTYGKHCEERFRNIINQIPRRRLDKDDLHIVPVGVISMNTICGYLGTRDKKDITSPDNIHPTAATIKILKTLISDLKPIGYEKC